ncbi:unnamed protein product [Clavelina lepadiformis]|uniref:Uncharacterized protein n=1 Tax=Clavelina lepadiformis TaxID=159417 RepID=A0ABP0G552_CLALP
MDKHLLIDSFDEDLSWDVQGRDSSLFDLEYDELVRRGTKARHTTYSTESGNYRVLNGTQFSAYTAKPSFAYAVQKLYFAEEAESLKETMREARYFVLACDLQHEETAGELSTNRIYGQDDCKSRTDETAAD